MWGGETNTRLDRLQSVVNFAARLVSGLRRYDSVTPTLAALGCPGLREIVARRDAVNVRRALSRSLRVMFGPQSAVTERLTRGASPLPPDGRPAALPVQSRRGLERPVAGCHWPRVAAPAGGRDRAVMVLPLFYKGLLVCLFYRSMFVFFFCVCM